MRYGLLYSRLNEILYRHDPIGVADGAPPDEYEPEVSTILPKLRGARNATDVRTIIHHEFVRWFDESTAGPEDAYSKIAEEVWQLLK